MESLETLLEFRNARETMIRAIREFRLCDSQRVVVGVSGGKDSIALLLLLDSAGLEVLPAIVDLGYRNFQAAAIKRVIEELGYAPFVLDALPQPGVEGAADYDTALQQDVRDISNPNHPSPCAPCSRLKRHALLQLCIAQGATRLVFAHHREDFITTLLKDYFVEKYYRAIGIYSAQAFRSFVQTCDLDFESLRQMVQDGQAATMAVSLPLSHGIRLDRPLVFVPESQLERIRDEGDLRTFGSGCSHEIFDVNGRAATTKREIVHAALRQRLSLDPSLGDALIQIAMQSLDRSGVPKSNPRYSRSDRLPGFES